MNDHGVHGRFRVGAAGVCALLLGCSLSAGAGQADLTGSGLGGSYPMSRDGSGTCWVPDVTPMDAFHGVIGDWMTMVHGALVLADTHQGSPRGASATFSESMLMGSARRSSDDSALTIRAMVSAEPMNGAAGYPLLLQTGETSNGRDPLIDRQHPHNLVMEFSLTYAHALSTAASWFVYAAPVGEPALGPPAFMHRRSSDIDPEAPLSHHHLDATHISFGVLTAGIVAGRWKGEVSAFNGREPDQHRSDIELRHFDARAVRLSFNPAPALALQISTAHLPSPETLNPGVALDRTTVSILHEAALGQLTTSTTVAYGRNRPSVGTTTDAWLWDQALRWNERTVLYGRVERVGSDEWPVAVGAVAAPIATKQSLGLQTDLFRVGAVRVALGIVGSRFNLPSSLSPVYGNSPGSWTVYLRGHLSP